MSHVRKRDVRRHFTDFRNSSSKRRLPGGRNRDRTKSRVGRDHLLLQYCDLLTRGYCELVFAFGQFLLRRVLDPLSGFVKIFGLKFQEGTDLIE